MRLLLKNGYAELRAKLHEADRHFVVVNWRWELQFAMWVVVPTTHIKALREEIDLHCRLLTMHLIRKGYGPDLGYPRVEID